LKKQQVDAIPEKTFQSVITMFAKFSTDLRLRLLKECLRGRRQPDSVPPSTDGQPPFDKRNTTGRKEEF
jgi:hypothetical protein